MSESRPDLRAAVPPAFREVGGYTFVLSGDNVVKLRELPGARGKGDEDLAAEFFDAQAPRWVELVRVTVAPPAEIRVVVDPYSRQVFLARDRTIVGILSF